MLMITIIFADNGERLLVRCKLLKEMTVRYFSGVKYVHVVLSNLSTKHYLLKLAHIIVLFIHIHIWYDIVQWYQWYDIVH